MSSLKHLIHEIHRRSIWQVLAVYLAGSWVALQVVDVVAEGAGLPAWVVSAALILLIIGLPIVIATALVQEGGPGSDGRKHDAGQDRDDASADAGPAAPGGPALQSPAGTGVRHRLFTWRNAVLGGVLAFALWGVAAAAWLVVEGRGPASPDAAAAAPSLRSIAVLPFVTRSESAEDQYFSEGMHDDLLTQLSKIDSLTVISRTSVLQYANTTERIPDIARTLGVSTILEGGVQRAGDRIRVNVQLIEAETDRHLWAETYDEELTAANVFAIQSDLARKIAQALQATLSPGVGERIDARPTESLAAYELYTRARYQYEKRGSFGEGLDEIISTYRQALDLDPAYAAAWAGLGHAYLAAVNWRRMTRDEGLPPAREAISRATQLDPALAEGHMARARLALVEDNDLAEAERELIRALELNPGAAQVYASYATILQEKGSSDEAIRYSRRAVELDPLSPAMRHLLADRLFYAGRFKESIAESERVIAMAGDDWYALYNLGWAQAALGNSGAARAAFHRALAVTEENAPTIRAGLAYAFARAAQRDSALHYLDSTGPANYDGALVRFTLGDEQLAFQMLEPILRDYPDVARSIARDPTAAAMRAAPGYTDLLRRLGLD